MPVVGSKLPLAGHPGLPGPPGVTGPVWSDAPSDGNTYGRAPGSWIPLLPLTGGTLANGITHNNVVGSGPTDCSSHLVLSNSGTPIGVCVLGSTLNYYSNPYTKMYLSGILSFTIGGTGTTQVAWGDFSSYPTMRWNGSQLIIYIAGGTATMTWQSGRFDFYAPSGVYCVGELWCSDVGVKPYTTTYTNGNNWRWDGTWMYARIDNSVEYPCAVACDARMKQDIEPSEFDALGTIRKVRLYEYRWLDHTFPGKVRRDPDASLVPIGLIAQRLYEDFSEAVKTGGVFKGAKMMWTPERFILLATLCRAMQQLDERVKALRDA